MKRFILPALLIFAISLFSSCAKKTTPPASGPTNSMSGTVSGTAWTAKTVSTVINSVDITITGSASDGSYMKFVMTPANVTAGTYPLTKSDKFTFQYNNGNTNYIVSSGTITISSYANKVMSATFSAAVSDPAGGPGKTVTNGSFTALFN